MPRHKKHSKTKTHTVTETRLLVASMAAFFAGALAFIAAPVKPQAVQASPVQQCKVDLVQYAHSCGEDKYRMRSYTCSDGFSPALDQRCMSANDIEREAKRFCHKRQCNVQAAPVNNQNK